MTILLLVFVGASLVVLIVRQTATAPLAAESARDQTAADVKAPVHQVIAYFFHGEVRCVTCLKIEEFAEEAIKSGFGAELSDKRLVWLPVNRDLPENKHFNEEYDLYTSSLILVNLKNNQQTEWINLFDVWEPTLLDDKEAFIEYVQSEVRFYLEGD